MALTQEGNSTFLFGNGSSSDTSGEFSSRNALLSWFVFTLLCCIFASVLTLALSAAIALTDALRRKVGYLILQCLILDLVICGATQLVYLIDSFASLRRIPLNLDCVTLMFLRVGALYADSWALFFLAFNRFWATFLPFGYKKVWEKGCVIGACVAFSWIVGFACAGLPLFGIGTHGRIQPWFICNTVFTQDQLRYQGVVNVLSTYFPIGTAGIFYAVVLVFFLVNRSPQRDRRKRTLLMLFAAYSFQDICFTPFGLLASYAPRVLFGNPEAFLWCITVQTLGYCGNPVIFLAINADYRNAVRRILRSVADRVGPSLSEHSNPYSASLPMAAHKSNSIPTENANR